jgi:hypothetical protein
MAIAGFSELCSSLCEIAGVPPTNPIPTDRGTWSAAMEIDGVEISLIQFASAPAGSLQLVADFGPMPQEGALAGWLLLADANLRLVGEAAPTFSRNPATGHVLLHVPVHLGSTNAVDVYQTVSQLAELGNKWRSGCFRDSPQQAYSWHTIVKEGQPVAEGDLRAGAEAFAALHRAVCNVRGVPAAQSAARPGLCAFPLDTADVKAVAIYSPLEDAKEAWVFVHLDDEGHRGLELVTALMEANFVLMVNSRRACFSCDTAGHGWQLQFPFPLLPALAPALLLQVHALAAFAREQLHLGKRQTHSPQPSQVLLAC